MMPSFHNGAVEIAYLDEGEGDPIVLVHGFASSKNVNWVYPTWVSELKKAGRRVIALDNRGHGDSGKLYDPAQYKVAIMAGDVIALLDHLRIERADIMGYSLGSRMTAVLALSHKQRLRSAILGGIGIGMIEGGGPGENVALALEAPSLEDVTDPVGRTFRAFADQTRSDRRALAACLRGSRRLMTRDEAAAIDVPVLIAGRHHGRNRGLGAGAGRDHSGRRSARHPEPRPHARGRRQGLQGWRHRISVTKRRIFYAKRMIFYQNRPLGCLISKKCRPIGCDVFGEGQVYSARARPGTVVCPPCYNAQPTSEFCESIQWQCISLRQSRADRSARLRRADGRSFAVEPRMTDALPLDALANSLVGWAL